MMRMRTRWSGFCLLLLSWLTVAPGYAQQAESDGRAVDASEVKTVLEQGSRLEQQRRWGEAITHYEEALRERPERDELRRRLNQARLRYDLARRYADRSFLEAVEQTSEREALELYAEILRKIHTYYVDTPHWDQMVSRGTESFDLALNDNDFAARHLQALSDEHVEAFRRYFRSQMAQQPVQTREQAQEAAAMAGRLAQRYLGISPAVAVFEYVCGAAGGLDRYSAFLSGDQLEELFSQIDGNFVGLGIELKADDNALVIVSVIPGGPADRGGLKAGDRIIAVDGRTTESVTTDVAADMLKGQEGSQVEITLVGTDGLARRLVLRRERVEVPSVEDVRIVDRELGVGYLRLTSFQKSTNREVDAALWKLHRDGMRSLIVDVRCNPGGLLNAAVEVADKFIAQGPIVSTRGRSSREDYDYKAHAVGTWRVPLIVLIDGESASASEIFAGAIADHRRGTIVGQQSYGKGSVQGIFPLTRGHAGVRLTTAKFYSPSGRAISNAGVVPHVVVHNTAKPTPEGAVAGPSDPVLGAALGVVRDQLTRRANYDPR